MKATNRCLFFLVCLATALLMRLPSRASDHADPMSLNVFALPKDQEANITDLHAFVVDRDGRYVAAGDPLASDNRLIISLCVRRALNPGQGKALSFKPYNFRVHLDLAPPVRFVDEDAPPAGAVGAELAAWQRDLSMQALYGGIITHPENIVDSAVLSFDLDLASTKDDEPRVILRRAQGSGFHNQPELLTLQPTQEPPANAIAVMAGIFDDPFIFPRFFRKNVVGIVTSIPLSALGLPPHDGPVPILLWGTTHKNGRQIDHVGRSLRTQLPRFGYLNDKPPRDHVRAVTRVHAKPTITEALLGAVVSPLFAHRHYDSVPDVMIYDLHKPARFPNGRWLEDDVAKTLADAGETLLLELSYAESRQFPRATTNDKTFQPRFPYLAPPWTKDEVGQHAQADAVAQPPDSAAIAPPNLDTSVWRQFFWLELAAIAALTIALCIAVRSPRVRIALIVAALAVTALLCPVYAENVVATPAASMAQTAGKLKRLGIGLGAISLLLVGFVYALGRRLAPPPAPEPQFPPDRQGPLEDDARTASYEEIHRALFDPRESRPYYRVWGSRGEAALPIYRTTFASLVKHFFSPRTRGFAMLQAAHRTLETRGDLRWGADHDGFRRLVHPMGVCLAGTWRIDATAPKLYSGYFAPGAEGRVIARYSLGGNHVENGSNRSLGLIGKVFPLADADQGDTPRAHFVTQEDLGGTFTRSVRDAVLTNSPPVTLSKRGAGIFAFLVVIVALRRADAQPADRQLYEIAELGKPDKVPTACPRFMRLTIADRTVSGGNGRMDFRDEILGMIYDRGNAIAKRKLAFTIEVSDSGRRTLFQRVVDQEWTRIGTITFDEAAASYNGDFVVHFHHPPWRRDRNDPDSVLRRDLGS